MALVWQILLVSGAAILVAETATFATSIYLHRALAHRSLALHPIADIFFRAILWLTTGQSRQEWVAVHRKHHAFTDQPGDPHSPKLLGLGHVFALNFYYYKRTARQPGVIATFAPDIVEDRWDRFIFSWGWIGLGTGIAILCFTFGLWAGLVAALTHAILYVFALAPIINGLGHWSGKQNFANTAYNWLLFAWITAGESLHNNHHARPRSPKFSIKWPEFDPSWLVIRALAATHLLAIRWEMASLESIS